MIKVVMSAAAVGTMLGMAPAAHADTTITAADICKEINPSYVPVIPVAQNFGACAASPAMAGVFYMPDTINGWMNNHYHGSYPVDPNNPFSDWIIPAGAGPAPPKPLIACNESGYCGPEVPVPCSGPGAPCG